MPRFLICIGVGLALTGSADAAPLTVSVTDGSGKPLAQAVVYVLVRGTKAQAEPGTGAQIGQRDRQFTPQVNVVQTGTAVSFPNFDTVRHHVYSFSPIQKFELKLYAGTPAAPVLFDKPGTAVLGCNIHDRMSAWVHVVDTPLFTKTDASGKATLEVPAGDHRLRAWHYLQAEGELPAEQALRMNADATVAAVKLTVQAAP
jgi:plastocyanin